jgi:membrane protein YqaA with SNARE-associated domain
MPQQQPLESNKKLKINNYISGQEIPAAKGISSHLKLLIFVGEIALFTGLLIWWLSSPSIRQSKSLWVLFFYSFPAEFLIALVPHEPILLYFGKYYPPLTVALIAVLGTIMTETLNYSVFKFVSDLSLFKKVHQKKAVAKIVDLFRRAPLAAIWVAGFTPVPFYPIRFLVVLSRYPVWKYILGVFLSRAPRFYILAYVGHQINIPDYLLVLLFVVLIASIYFPSLVKYLKNRRKKRINAS